MLTALRSFFPLWFLYGNINSFVTCKQKTLNLRSQYMHGNTTPMWLSGPVILISIFVFLLWYFSTVTLHNSQFKKKLVIYLTLALWHPAVQPLYEQVLTILIISALALQLRTSNHITAMLIFSTTAIPLV